MPKADSSLNMLIVAAVVALGIGYYVPQTFSQKSPANTAKAPETPKPAPKAAAEADRGRHRRPGRVEPMGGDIRISAQAPGRIADVLVAVNDKVVAGDLMVRLADEELVARVHAARAEVAVRKRDRDNETVQKAAQDRRTAEDNFANAERTLSIARGDLDRALKGRRADGTADAEIDKAREAATQAANRLEEARTALRKAMAADNSPAQTRLEAALVAGRAELSIAEAGAGADPRQGALCRHRPAGQCPGRRDGGAVARKPARGGRRCQRTAGQGRVRGARRRQDARRPGRRRALGCFPRARTSKAR